jgi:hypothetical protein
MDEPGKEEDDGGGGRSRDVFSFETVEHAYTKAVELLDDYTRIIPAPTSDPASSPRFRGLAFFDVDETLVSRSGVPLEWNLSYVRAAHNACLIPCIISARSETAVNYTLAELSTKMSRLPGRRECAAIAHFPESTHGVRSAESVALAKEAQRRAMICDFAAIEKAYTSGRVLDYTFVDKSYYEPRREPRSRSRSSVGHDIITFAVGDAWWDVLGQYGVRNIMRYNSDAVVSMAKSETSVPLHLSKSRTVITTGIDADVDISIRLPQPHL